MLNKIHLEALFDERNSLLFWFPKIQNLGIPVPMTRWIELPSEIGIKLMDRSEEAFHEFQPYLEQIIKLATEIGYPIFIRTDMASHKHGWKDASFVRKEDDLLSHIIETIEFNEMAGMIGLNYKAIVIRKFLELDWRFKAFHGEMPVARERRYFVKDGKVLCHHWYWVKEAIDEAHKDEGKDFLGHYIPYRLPNQWEKMLEEINTETEEETSLLTDYAEKVSKVIEGFWSVDFACSRKGKWYLIDMALGKASYHPECEALK